MTATGAKRGRTHDAEGAREAILDAAERVFAEHGFDGARVDAIAAEASYNKSLIFQYFGDKLGLYSAIIRRLDEQTRDIQSKALETLVDLEINSNPSRLKAMLRTYLRAYFDFLIAHPRLQRILLWEMAEGWETYSKVLTQSDFDDVETFKPVLEKLLSSGMLRSDFRPMAQLLLMEFMYPTFLACLPLYQMLLPNDDVASPEMLAKAGEFVIEFVLHGMFTDGSET